MALDSNLSKETMLKGLIGSLPIPVVGEISLSMFFYDLLEESGFKYAGIPAALLTRYCMWSEIYIPLYQTLNEIF